MTITSPAFKDNGPIPSKFTCDGDDVSPALEWSELPSDTRSVALICDDPDAPSKIWVHWVLFNVPPGTHALPERVATTRELPDGSRQGLNDFGRVGYGGPCPPSGTHHYRFSLYALDATLDIAPASARKDVETAMAGHVLETALLTGTYTRAA